MVADNQNRDAEIIAALLNDDTFDFKEYDKELRSGRCPDCNKRTVWVKKEKPGRVWCNHENKCGYTQTTYELYPDLFENYAERYPATPDDPNATARAYLSEKRGFNTGLIAGWYEQGAFPLGNNQWAPTVRIRLWDGFYWERLIDKAHEKQAGRKNSYKAGIKKKDKHWQPPGFELNDGDTCIITEGIFDAWAFLHYNEKQNTKYKAVASFDCGNLPKELIEANRNRGITWILAYDNDQAGLKHLPDHLEAMDSIGETVQVMLTRYSGKDWNDELNNGNLKPQYLRDALWRGSLAIAKNPQEKAFWLWVKSPRKRVQLDFGNALYRYTVDEKGVSELRDALAAESFDALWTDPQQDVNYAQMLFYSALSGERISNCMPAFLYIEQDALTDEQYYFFQFGFANGTPKVQVPLDGSCLESPSSFNKALLNRTPGGTFDGDAKDLKLLREKWFDRQATYVKTLPFVGYDKDSGTYVFPGFGFRDGRRITINEQGFLQVKNHRIKTGLKSLALTADPEPFNPEWVTDYIGAYGNNGIITMAWWLGTMFAEQIRQKQKSWPFMELTGEQGAGKSTILEFLWRCVGRTDYEGFDPSTSSLAGRARNFQQGANLPVILLESDRSSEDRGARKKSFDMDELKTAYNGRGIRAMGVKKRGAETEEPPFRGGVLISQNATVDGSDALLARIVHCHCTKEHFSRKTEAMATRLGTLSTEELASWRDQVLSMEKELLEMFEERFTAVREAFYQLANETTGVQNRLILNHAQVAAWVYGLQLVFGKKYMTDVTINNAIDYLWDRCLDRQRRLNADHPIVEQFWEIYELLNIQTKEPEFPGEMPYDIEILNHSANPELIAINLAHFNQVCTNRKAEQIPTRVLKKLLANSQRHKFIDTRKVKSQVTNKTMHCWVFENRSKKS